jgi:hypothetical protein
MQLQQDGTLFARPLKRIVAALAGAAAIVAASEAIAIALTHVSHRAPLPDDGCRRTAPSGVRSIGWTDASVAPESEERSLDLVGSLLVLEWKCMGVVPKRRRRVTVTEPVLCAEQIALAHEEGRDGVPQPVERDSCHAGFGAEFGEPMSECASGEALAMVEVT